MKRTHHVIAAMVVATALCADRVVSAPSQQSRPPVTQIARTLAARLTLGFRRVVASMRLMSSRVGGRIAALPAIVPTARPVVVHASACSPFRFRLPPPVA